MRILSCFFSVFFILLLSIMSQPLNAQSLDQQLLDQYEAYKEPTITHRRFKHQDIKSLILALEKPFSTHLMGKSIEGREIYLVKAGTGKTSVLLWSQMHGDEATATMALMDLFNFMNQDDDFNWLREKILNNLTLYFIPMLNPDGADRFQRRNALGVDLNRDALRLQNPETQILKRVRDSLDAEWGFNLHDQGRYYGVGNTPHAAAFSFLAPAYNYEKEINEVRGKAMKQISAMNKILQKYIPGKIAKYNDDFEPRAFGDNIQKWGTSTILIESGGFKDDWEKQYLRKLHFMLLLETFNQIADQSYEKEEIAGYNQIPFNNRGLIHDLIMRKVQVELDEKWYLMDIGIRQYQIVGQNGNYTFGASIDDLGDLHNFYGYHEYDGKTEVKVIPGKVYPEVISSFKKLKKMDLQELFTEGYTYFQLKRLPDETEIPHWPIVLLDKNTHPDNSISMGNNPVIFLEKGGAKEHYVINGQLFTVAQTLKNFSK